MKKKAGHGATLKEVTGDSPILNPAPSMVKNSPVIVTEKGPETLLLKCLRPSARKGIYFGEVLRK